MSRDISASPKSQEDAAERRGRTPFHVWRFLAAAGGIVVTALLLRLYHIGTQELWVDEAFSWHMATTSKLLRWLLDDNSPPLYYLLLRGWVVFAGQSEAALRLVSAIAGTLFVVAVIWAGREFFDARVALWSGGVAALAPIHIYYSQEARAYALLTLVLVLHYALLWRVLQRNAWPWWTLLSTITVLALYTHYLAVFGLVPGVFLVLAKPETSRWRPYAAAMGVSFLLFVPWALWSLVLTPRSPAGVSWQQVFWERTPPLLAIPLSLEVFSLGPQAGLLPGILKQFTTLAFPSALRLLDLTVLALLGLWVAIPWGDRNVGVPDLSTRKAWLGLLLVFPLLAMWLVSLFKPIYVVGRYDLVAFPAFPLLLGLAMSKVQRMKIAGTLLAPIVVLLLLIPVGTKLFRYYQAPPGAQARRTAEVLDGGVADGDVVVFTTLRGLPVLYYLNRLGYRWVEGYRQVEGAGRRFACRMYPRETEANLASYDPRRVLASADAVRADVQDLFRMLRPGGTLWVAFGSGRYLEGNLRLVEADVRLFQELRRVGLDLSLVQGAPLVFRSQRIE